MLSSVRLSVLMYISPSSFDLENMTVENGRLDAKGSGYQAIILNQQDNLPYDTAKKLLEYAKNGLPIIVVGDFATNNAFYQEDNISNIIAELKNQPTVKQVFSVNDVVNALNELNISPAAKYHQQSSLLNYHRQVDDKDIYYFYNYGNVDTYRDASTIETVETTVTLKGTGVPYQFNTWTGEISPIAKYTKNGDSVTVDISLAGNDSTVIVLMDAMSDVQTVTSSSLDIDYDENNQLIAKGSNQQDTVVLNNGEQKTVSLPKAQDSFVITNWDLTIESWLPGDTPTSTLKQEIKVGTLNNLVPWNKIEGCQNVSGIGTYKASFDVNQGWKDGSGAYLDLGAITDTYTLSINGQLVKANQIDTLIDIGPYLKTGTNTIEVKVASTLLNAVLAVNEDDDRSEDEYGILNDVQVIPYTYCKVNAKTEDNQDGSIETPDNSSDNTKQDNSKTKAVDTGDEMAIGLHLMLIVIAGGVYYQLNKRS